MPDPLTSNPQLYLDSIQQTVTTAQFISLGFGTPMGLSQFHPLANITDGLSKAGVASLTFKLDRIVNNRHPDPPNWARVKIRVTADNSSYVEETVLLSPIEIGNYGLVMRGAMNLSGASAIGSRMDVPVFPNRNPPVAGLGLHFLSPVFLNGNLVLPNPTATTFTNVTFHDKVALAPLPLAPGVSADEAKALVVKSNLDPYAPTSFGGISDSTYADIQNIGGLRSGVQLQSSEDWGAFFLFDPRANGADPATLRQGMLQCVNRSQILADLSVTQDSRFIIRQTGNNYVNDATQQTFDYFLGLSKKNNFYAAKNRLPQVISTSGSLLMPSDPPTLTQNNANFTRPILKVTIDMGANLQVVSHLTRSSELSIPLLAMSTTALNNLLTAKNTASATKVTAQSDLSTATNALNTAQANLTAAQDTYNTVFSVPTPPMTPAHTAAQAALTTAQNAYNSALLVSNSKTNALNSATAAEVAAINAYNAALNAQNNHPVIKISTSNVRMDQTQFKIRIENPVNMPAGFNIQLFACEIGTDKFCNNKRISGALNVGVNYTYPKTLNYNATGPAYNKTIASQYLYTLSWTDSLGNPITAASAPPAMDPATLDSNCFGVSSAAMADTGASPTIGTWILTPSFKFAGFAASFLTGARVSWDFSPLGTTLNISNSNQNDFHIYGIVPSCVIKQSATFFAGFVVCDNFIIESRNTPLQIVGTVITGHVSIHPNAIKAGIRWSSIYHPEGVAALQSRKILHSGKFSNGVEIPCGTLISGAGALNHPAWNPRPDFETRAATIRCSPLSLRSRANPFTWHSVEPLCGILSPGASSTSCKIRRPMVYKEISLGKKESL